MRFVGERKACAAIVLAFFGMLFLLNGIAGPPAFAPMFLSLGAVYLAGFVGVVAGWFWARWYALGLSFSGLMIAAMLWWRVGLDPAVLIWGGAHAVLGLALVGRGPASAFDGRPEWRERFRMDDNAAHRLGKAIMRAGASLPYLIMAALAPRQATSLAGLVAFAGAVAGLAALARLRTWGLFALAGAGVLAVTTAAAGPVAATSRTLALAPVAGPLAAILLAAAVAPFAVPLVRALRRP